MQALIKEDISKRVLTFGPDYKNHRGGIGAVIAVYSTFFERFNFVSSYRSYKSNLAKAFYFIGQAFRLTGTLIANREIRIVHIHGSHGGSFYRKFVAFVIARKLFGKKTVYHIHSGSFDAYYFSSSGLQKKMIRHLINKADAVICLAPVWKQFLVDHFNCKKIFIVNNVVPEPTAKARLDMTAQESVVNLLFLGKIGDKYGSQQDRKGIFDLVEVIRRSHSFFAGKLRLFIGGNGEVDKLEALLSEHGLGDVVEYVGWVDKEKKTALLLRSHIYILPAYYEGLPGSILEAMSYGLPVISTPVGGIPEVVKHGINGRLVNPGNLEEINAALRFFLDDKNRISEYGGQSLRLIGPFFPERVSSQLQEVYTSLL